MRRSPALLVIATYALLALLVVPVYPHFPSPNELTRWVLAAALVEHRTVEVSPEAAILGPRFEDLAVSNGRTFSNKAPGAALIALPGYLLVRPVIGPPSANNLRPALDAMRWFGATLPLLLLALLMMRLGRAHGIREERIGTVVWLLLFATPLFAYGLLLFGHALVAATLFAAWALLYGFPSSSRPAHAWLAGACLGVAVMSEYPAALPLLVLVLALAVERDWPRLLRLLGGGAPFALLLAGYQWLAFGSPFHLSYGLDKLPQYRQLEESGIVGVGFPSPVTLTKLLLHPAKGLFVFAPVLLLAIPAFAAARSRFSRAGFITLLAMPATLLLLYSGYPNWHGGWNVGPRYIVAIIPFLIVPLLFRDGTFAEWLLGGVSLLAVTLTTLVFPFVPNEMSLPWGTLAWPLLRRGLVMPNLLHFAGTTVAVIAPFALVVVATLVALGTRRRPLVAVFVGALLALAIGVNMAALVESPVVRIERGYFAEVYFGRTGALEEEAAPLRVPPSLRARERAELATPPSPWPF